MNILLSTSRLTLRAVTGKDAGNLYRLNSDPEVMRYLNGGNPTPQDEITEKVIPFMQSFYGRSDGLGYWIAETRGDQEFLGWFHFRPDSGQGVELGYRLRRPSWNQGYATEGSRALILRGFTELDLDRIWAHTMTVNYASRRVLEKCGLILIRTFFSDQYELPGIPGADEGEVEYALTRDQWLAGPGRTAGR